MIYKTRILEQICTVTVLYSAVLVSHIIISNMDVCFITVASSADGSTGSMTHDGAGSFKTHSVYSTVDEFEQSRQPSYLAAVIGSSEASQSRDSNSICAPVNCTTRDTSQDLLYSVSQNGLVTDKNHRQCNKQSAPVKNQMPVTASKCETSVSEAPTKLHSQSFSDLAQWLQNGEDDTAGNYIDRRVVESVLKCRQFRKQFPEKKSNSHLPSQRLNCVTNIGRAGSHEARQQRPCRSNVTDNVCQEFNAKLETEVDDDSGFSGDRNSASSTTSLGSVTDFLSGERSISGSATSVLSVDQSTIQSVPSMSHIPGPVPLRTTGQSNISSSNASQVTPDAQGNRLLSEQIYVSLSRRKIVEPSSQSCRPCETSSVHGQEPLPSAANSGWCSSDEF